MFLQSIQCCGDILCERSSKCALLLNINCVDSPRGEGANRGRYPIVQFCHLYIYLHCGGRDLAWSRGRGQWLSSGRGRLLSSGRGQLLSSERGWLLSSGRGWLLSSGRGWLLSSGRGQ